MLDLVCLNSIQNFGMESLFLWEPLELQGLFLGGIFLQHPEGVGSNGIHWNVSTDPLVAPEAVDTNSKHGLTAGGWEGTFKIMEFRGQGHLPPSKSAPVLGLG